jgi:diguanylate cyclase (GGDEF)-like protein
LPDDRLEMELKMAEKIMIMDDSQTSRMMMETALNDYQVISASNTKEYFEILKTGIPDLILCDIMMPDINGIDLMSETRKIPDYRDIPFIFVTGNNSINDLEKCFHLGAHDFIRKPFEPVELKARVASVIRIKKLEYELRKISVTDYLSGAYNRRYFYERAVAAVNFSIRKKNNISLGILDIDHFKTINDQYGHDAGDFVIKTLSSLIARTIRLYDIFARFGGEEFIILFPDTDKHTALKAVNRFKDTLSLSRFQFNNHPLQFTFSCGITDLEENGWSADIDAFIKSADERLYKAKQTGRNRIVID